VSIAAASIVAKVYRDRFMAEQHCRYPAYGFDHNKGYGTRRHLEALRHHGPCPLHRRSFRGVLPR
jgi:ribonuclease HII